MNSEFDNSDPFVSAQDSGMPKDVGVVAVVV
jgi:hypothetical protein